MLCGLEGGSSGDVSCRDVVFVLLWETAALVLCHGGGQPGQADSLSLEQDEVPAVKGPAGAIGGPGASLSTAGPHNVQSCPPTSTHLPGCEKC